jgi:hypothetical protein
MTRNEIPALHLEELGRVKECFYIRYLAFAALILLVADQFPLSTVGKMLWHTLRTSDRLRSRVVDG